MPYSKNPFFTGRDDILADIHNSLSNSTNVAIGQPPAISGLGGIGKTQTAIEYCYRHINAYTAILWVRAENQTVFNDSYSEIVTLLGLRVTAIAEPLKPEQTTSLVKTWLVNNSNWLMVLDNLEHPNLLNHYLPHTHNGHILITTQIDNLGIFAKTINLEKMDYATGSLFLLRRIGLIQEKDPLDKAGAENLKSTIDIVKEMDGLPLALDQAAAYILQTKSSLDHYLSLYKDTKHSAKLRNKRGKYTVDHISVFATFKLAFEKVEKQNPIAAQVLQACSFLSPDSIPEEVFTSAGNLLTDELVLLVDDTLAWDDTLELLLNFSLIKRDSLNHSLSIHRLVQAVTRDLIDDPSKQTWIINLVKAAVSFCPTEAQHIKYWSYYQRMLPNILNLASFLDNYITPDNAPHFEQAGTLFNSAGVYCLTQGNYDKALKLCQQAAFITTNTIGYSHPNNASILTNIAAVYNEQGKFSEALWELLEALFIFQTAPGDNQVSTAITFNGIAGIYKEQGIYKKALDLYEEALAIYKAKFGNNNFYVATALNNIANVYHDQSNYDQALDFYKQALPIYKSTNDDLSAASVLNNMGLCYECLGDFPQALSLLQEVLDIRRNLLGNAHPDTGQIIESIAGIYDSQCNYIEALPLYKEALKIKKTTLGYGHPSVANTLNSIGLTYYALRDYDQALDFYFQALSIYEQTLSNNHINCTSVLNNIASVYTIQKKFSEAEQKFLEALKIQQQILEKTDPDIALTLVNIGCLYYLMSKQQQAIDSYKEALCIYDNSPLPSNHHKIILLLKDYSTVLLKLNRTDEAQPLLERIKASE